MKALLIIDVQNDFLPGGALPIPQGDEVISVINAYQEHFDLVIATKDWHPPRHISFASRHRKLPGECVQRHYEQQLWPDHCIQNTRGAAFPSSLHTSKISQVFFKGSDPEIDSYSAFFDNVQQRSTGLNAYLKEKHVDEIYIVGLATDVCVKYSVLDALTLGFKVFLLEKGCRGIRNIDNAIEEMRCAGATILPDLN